MKGLENQTYLIMYLVSNLVALVLLLVSIKRTRLAKVMYALLFGWASWTNWTMVANEPEAYLGYADLTFSSIYESFIRGWFSRNIEWVVGTIATCQGLIAVGLLLKGWIYKLACIGAISFLVAISPFGVGAGFPATITMAIGIGLLFRHHELFIWEKKHEVRDVTSYEEKKVGV